MAEEWHAVFGLSRRVSSFVQWSEPDFRGYDRKRRDSDGEHARPLEPPAHAEERRPHIGEQAGQRCDAARRRRRSSRSPARAVHSSAASRNSSTPSACASRNARSSRRHARELARDRQREHDIGAGPRREMEVGALAIAVRRGSTTTSCAPPRCAFVTSGGKCVLLTAGFAPHTTTSRACTTSSGSAESIRRTSRPTPCRGSPRRSCRRPRMRRAAEQPRRQRALQRRRRRAVDPGHHRRGPVGSRGVADAGRERDRARRPTTRAGTSPHPSVPCARAE